MVSEESHDLDNLVPRRRACAPVEQSAVLVYNLFLVDSAVLAVGLLGGAGRVLFK